MDPGAQPLERRDDVGVGMAVSVVDADAEQRDGRTDGHQERRIGGGGPVVRDGEDLGAQAVGCPREQLGLPLPLHVAG